jgi:hypothetical protein
MNERTFKCRSCKKSSRYGVRASVMRFDMITTDMSLELLDEVRTYVCEHCKEENKFKKTMFDWKEVDQR